MLDDMTNEEPTRPGTDAEVDARLGEPTLESPVWVVLTLFQCLEDPQHWADALHNLTTPESWPDWDWPALAERMRHHSVMSEPDQALGEDLRPVPDVVWVKLPWDPDQTEPSFQVAAESGLLMHGAIATLVYRPDLGGGWRIHHIGEPAKPEELVRSGWFET
jgi:hypothetical protein